MFICGIAGFCCAAAAATLPHSMTINRPARPTALPTTLDDRLIQPSFPHAHRSGCAGTLAFYQDEDGAASEEFLKNSSGSLHVRGNERNGDFWRNSANDRPGREMQHLAQQEDMRHPLVAIMQPDEPQSPP